MPFEEILYRADKTEETQRRAKRSGSRRDDGRRQERDGQPFDFRQHGTIYDQTDDTVDVVG
jgi:hypothetical protein